MALGDLPLALEQAGALQRETGMPSAEYLEQLREHTRRMLDEGKPSDYPVSMTAAWRISVDLLAAAEPGALALLRCCAFFGPDPIPRDVFRRGIRQTGSPLSEVLSDPILLARAIRDLGRFALATIDSTNRTVTIHRLIQALIRDDLDADEQETFRHEVHLLLAGATPADPGDEAQWRRFAELVPHLGPLPGDRVHGARAARLRAADDVLPVPHRRVRDGADVRRGMHPLLDRRLRRGRPATSSRHSGTSAISCGTRASTAPRSS